MDDFPLKVFQVVVGSIHWGMPSTITLTGMLKLLLQSDHLYIDFVAVFFDLKGWYFG